MKKITISSLLFAFSLISVLSASANTISIPGGIGDMAYYGKEYVGPLGANLDGKVIIDGITCLDIYSTTYVPNSGFGVTVETLTSASLANARFQSSDTLFKYEEAAWLNTQLHAASNKSQIGEIQFAMWRLFTPTASSGADKTGEDRWMNLAADAMKTPANYDFSSVRIYTPTGSYASNQEFISGGATAAPVPEPATMLLFGTGLVSLAGMARRKMQ